ncbi:hypothetical protein N7527_011569 [Penicillium freii]|uniref:Phytase A n=1 Tax=Penicillium freii TaxID=48697 RepID=A0A101MQX6_PENFR|nr:hypothetical protein N7527_011569 [Penicillium freii]KUM65064.1 hypothetical protein ACN42_g2027 [Penicillium freii]
MAAFSKEEYGQEEGLLGESQDQGRKQQRQRSSPKWRTITLVSLLGAFALFVYFAKGSQCNRPPSHVTTQPVTTQPDLPVASPLDRSKRSSHHEHACNTVDGGYQCNSSLSHKWGQYSPYFSLSDESAISNEVPHDCQITFAQVISRHGARFPSAKKSKGYAALVKSIQANATSYKGNTGFIRTYNYTMGGDDLVPFGVNQMVHSGTKFYQRYAALAKNAVPFIRISDSERVVASGVNFIKGFHKAKSNDKHANHRQSSPKVNVLISEESGTNNTLNHSEICAKFEKSELSDEVEEKYIAIFVPPIRARLEANLPGIKLEDSDVISLMDICPFDTVSRTSDASKLSPFCDLFTQDEWNQYDYLQSLSKYYGYGAGNPLGPTQGVGLVNELIARLTHTPVVDNTSTNRTLDAPGAATFPLNYTMYADFTHDNGMIPFFFALGLYNGTSPLSLTKAQSTKETDGFSSSWTVPFGARAYVEMMQCRRDPEPLVRVLVNDRVVPLHGCPVDKLGRCRRRDFVKGLTFARSGGDWPQCYE